VTIDLNGFALVGYGGGLGIGAAGSVTNLSVYNGTVRNWAFCLGTLSARNSRFEKLRLSASTVGLEAGFNSVVADSVFLNAGDSSNPALSIGDGCEVRNCAVGGPSQFGIAGGNGDLIESCVLRSNLIGVYVGTNCTIRNCNVTACGEVGINTQDGAAVVGCQSQGSGQTGIVVGNNSLVEDCLARSNSFYGITGSSSVTFRHCTAINTGSGPGFSGGLTCIFDGCQSVSNAVDGIMSKDHATVHDCSCQGNLAAGLNLGSYCLVRNCQANQNGVGITVVSYSRIIDCQCIGNVQRGIYVQADCSVSGCLCDNNGSSGIYIYEPGCKVTDNTCNANNTGNLAGDAGIFVDDSYNLIEGNHVDFNGNYGIYVVSGYQHNVIIRNNVGGSLTNYFIPAGNDPGPIGNAATATSPWANISN
jgi:parallel beta-helix repeat protein